MTIHNTFQVEYRAKRIEFPLYKEIIEVEHKGEILKRLRNKRTEAFIRGENIY